MTATEQPSWFGQPRGLTILFLTEMWEKFSFFGMRALLIYYMTKQLLIDQEQASLVYGVYAAGVYLTPILGGFVADRWLGCRRAVILGGSVMAVGHFLMAFESLFYSALVTIAIGNGLFLPNLPSQIPSLYRKGDPRHASAYNIYYVGVNLGAFLAPVVCGTLGELFGWHYGFGAAGIGMLLGLLIYVLGSRVLPLDVRTGNVREQVLANDDKRRRLTLLLAVAAVVVVFRGAYEQIGNTVALWADVGIDRTISAGSAIPMTWFQSLNPLFVFLFTPLLVRWWARQAKQGREMPPLIKMALGAVVVALAYATLAAVSLSAGDGRVSWIWLLLFFVAVTAGELFILPTGLGLFGRLAPPGFAATAVALWFLGGFGGNLLAGVLGTYWLPLGPGVFFALMAAMALMSALLFFHINGRKHAGSRRMLPS